MNVTPGHAAVRSDAQHSRPGAANAGSGLSEAARYSMFMLLPLLFVSTFFLYPAAETVWRSVTGGTFPGGLYLDLLQDDVFLLSLRNTFFFAVLTTICAVLLGYPVAILIGFSRPAIGNLLLLLIMVPFWTSILVRSYAWLVLLGREGLVNATWIGSGLGEQPMSLIFNSIGVSIGMIHVMLPYMILPVISTISRINKETLSAASSLGASRWQSFVRVLLPLTLPGIAGGAALVFVISLGFFITPALMGGPRDLVTAMVIHDRITRQLAWDEAAAISVVLLLLTGGTFFICARIFNLQRHMSMSK
jgi:putative spermidine/putrescine transport system permease protein